jgi:hypothetical protein
MIHSKGFMSAFSSSFLQVEQQGEIMVNDIPFQNTNIHRKVECVRTHTLTYIK